MALLRNPLVVRAVRLVTIYLVAIVAFVLALTAVYALPQGRILEHVRDSVPLLKSEGLDFQPLLDKAPGYKLDNFTDALMLDTSIVTTDRGPLYAAMGAFNGGASDEKSPILALSQTVAGNRQILKPYAYYWHGYQVLLRPALLLVTYSDIRYLNILLLGTLLLVVGAALRRAGDDLLAGAFLLSLVLAGLYVVPLSMQFSSVVYVTLLATLVVVAFDSSGSLPRRDVELFFVVGMLTSFVDLLTAPLLTLGMPLAVVLILFGRREQGRDVLRSVARAALLSLAWAVGYATSWVTKWFVGSAVLHTNVAGLAESELLYRMGTHEPSSRVMEALAANVLKLFPMVPGETLLGPGLAHNWLASPYVVILPVLVLTALWLLLFNRKPAAEIVRVLPVLSVVPLPYLWIAIASNHSAIHASFTYRIQAMVVFAVTYALLASVDFGRVQRRLGLLGYRRRRGCAAEARHNAADG